MNFLLSSIIILFVTHAAAETMGDAAGQANSIIGKVNQTAPLSSNLTTTVPNYSTSSPTETGYSNGNMSDAATQKAATDPASKLINQSFATRPDIIIDRNTNPIFQKAKTVTDNPSAVVNSLTGQYGDCSAKPGTPITTKDVRTCDEYVQQSDQTCLVGENVIVDSTSQYKCNRQRIYQDYTCERSLTVTCANQGGNAGGITAGAIPSNITWSYNYPTLQIGADFNNTYPDFYYDFYGIITNTFIRVINFNISDLSQINKFSLSAAYFQNILTIYVNGTIVYNHTDDPPPTSTNLINSPLNLLPYLHQGNNTLQVQVMLVNVTPNMHSTANLTFDTGQTGCSQWIETWSDGCTGYEQ